MTYLCTAPHTSVHDWSDALPAPVVQGFVCGDLRDCPDHDGLPNAEGQEHREQQEKY